MLPDDEIDRYIVLCGFFAGSFTVGVTRILGPCIQRRIRFWQATGAALLL